MSEPLRHLLAEGGAGNRAAWFSAGENILIPAQAQLANNGTFEQLLWQVPKNNLYDLYGAKNASPLDSANTINLLWSVWLTFGASYTQTAGGGMTLRLYRAGSLVNNGSSDIAGWPVTTNANGVPTTAAWTPVQLPWVTANTDLQAPANQTVSSTVAYLRLQPLDVLTLFYNNKSGGNWTPPTVNVEVDCT